MEASRIDAFAEAEALVDEFGPRPPGSDAERRAAQHLAGRLEELGREVHLEGFSVWPRWATGYAINAGVAVVGGVLAVYAAALGTGIVLHRADPHLPRRRRHHADHAAAARPAGVAERRLVRRARDAGRARPGRPLRQRSDPLPAALAHVPRDGDPARHVRRARGRHERRRAHLRAVPRDRRPDRLRRAHARHRPLPRLPGRERQRVRSRRRPPARGAPDRPELFRRPHRLHRRAEGQGAGHARLPPDPPQAVRARRDDRHQHRRRGRRRAPGDEEGGPAADRRARTRSSPATSTPSRSSTARRATATPPRPPASRP